jgi:hypothetical protein
MPRVSDLTPAATPLDGTETVYVVQGGNSRRATAQDLLSSGDGFLAKAIGEPFELWDHITGCPIPSNSGEAKFIKLTAGLTGVGEYNEGLLGTESVTGTAPLVEATATILVGPMTGQTVHLINTEEAFLRARETSGALQMDQMQRITGQIRATAGGTIGLIENASGALSPSDGPRSETGTLAGSASRYRAADFNSADSPDARVSSTTSGETRSKNVSATYYLRIA